MIVGGAENVLLDVGILPGPGLVLDPDADAELLGERVLEHVLGHDGGRVGPVELEDLVGLAALVPGEARRPGGGGARGRQQVDAVARGAAELALAAHRVGVAVAALADVVRGEAEGGPQAAQVAGRVAEFQAGRGQQRLRLNPGSVVHALRHAAPARRADSVNLFAEKRGFISDYVRVCACASAKDIF